MKSAMLRASFLALALMAVAAVTPAAAYTECYYNRAGDYVCHEVSDRAYSYDDDSYYDRPAYSSYSPRYDDDYYDRHDRDRSRNNLTTGLIAAGVANEAFTGNFHTRRAIRKGIVGGVLLNELTK